jgi:GNAT superfamily N-acetyltransferase
MDEIINKSEIENSKSDISIEQIRPELTWQLRRDVLYPTQRLPEMEMEEDADGIHFGAFKDNWIVGVVSIFQKGDDFQFRKLAVKHDLQGIGIGGSLLEYVTQYVIHERGARIWCNARTSAIGFYLKAGFTQTGELFSRNGVDYEILEKVIALPGN